jgi:flagellar basal body-associated protein FliL
MNTTTADNALQRKVKRDIWIIIITVIVVGAVVVIAILFWGLGGVLGIALAALVVGAITEIGKVIAIRYDQAAKSSRVKGGVHLADMFEGKSSKASEWSSAAALFTWVLGIGAALTAASQLFAK